MKLLFIPFVLVVYLQVSKNLRKLLEPILPSCVYRVVKLIKTLRIPWQNIATIRKTRMETLVTFGEYTKYSIIYIHYCTLQKFYIIVLIARTFRDDDDVSPARSSLFDIAIFNSVYIKLV